MASTARWGLKRCGARRIGRASLVGMASTARWGLKHPFSWDAPGPLLSRNGLYSPLGIETCRDHGMPTEKE